MAMEQLLWDTLPEECKTLIFQRLSSKELARSARISTEFAHTARAMRNGVRSLVLPPNVKISTLQEMVAAYANLRSLSFRRFGAKLKAFVPLLEAATGNLPASVRGVPVFWRLHSLEAVDFRGCVHLSDEDVAELCWLHPKIQEINLTNCQALTDAALVTLSRHRRMSNVNVVASSEGEHDSAIGSARDELPWSDGCDSEGMQALTKDNQGGVKEKDVDRRLQPVGSYSDDQAWPQLGEAASTSKPKLASVPLDAVGPALAEESRDADVLASLVVDKKLGSSNDRCGALPTKFSYAQAAGQAFKSDQTVTEPPIMSPTHADDIQSELQNIRGWPRRNSDSHVAVCRADEHSGHDSPWRQDRMDLSRSSVISGSKVRFGTLSTTRTSERCPEHALEAAGLLSVCIAGCSNVTDRGVQALLKGTSRTSLISLDVSRCGGVTNNGLKVPSNSTLESLTAVQMQNITRLRFQLSDDQGLKHLNLASCTKLEELLLVAPHLQALNLSGCKQLNFLQLKCPSLESLNISLCEILQRFGRFECGALQSLNAIGCRMLTTAAMTMVLECGGALQELRCSGCDRIDSLSIPQLSLLRLEVSGCSSLKRLFSQSRILRVVDACGCKTLEETRLHSPFLQRMLFTNCSRLRILTMPFEGMKSFDDTFEIAISGAYSLPEGVRTLLEVLSRQLKHDVATTTTATATATATTTTTTIA